MRSSRTTTLLFVLVLVMDLLAVTVALGDVNVDPNAAFAGGRSHVKVAIIVGPVGHLTDYYRELADEAAAAARAKTDGVVTVYSPNATWPAARAALDGASIVLYLGHGNGWPSPYRDKLYRRTQNGLGLNPVAGEDDDAHQYFGERYIAEVELAPGAVVILSHLCYASGNPEPGGPEPTVDVARQRVDNFAAGWMAAGAVAVIAEGHGRPTYYMKSLLQGRGTIEDLWLAAPTFHDHVMDFDNARTSGAQLMLDPDRKKSGFYRSLAVMPGARVADMLRLAPAKGPSAAMTSPTPGGSPDVRELARLGARFGTPEFVGAPVAAMEAALTIPVDAATSRLLPDGVMVGTRWDPLAPDGVPAEDPDATTPVATEAVPSAAVPSAPSMPGPEVTSGPEISARPEPTIGRPRAIATATPEATDTPPANPSASADPLPIAGPTVTSRSGGAGAPDDPPTIDLIGPERPGKLVTTHPSIPIDKGLSVPITMPAEPGLYRLVTTIHDADGVAFGAETQDLVGALLVRVTGAVWASYGVPTQADVRRDQEFTIRVRLGNTGTVPWSQGDGLATALTTERAPLLVGRWVSLDDIATFAVSAGPGVVIQAFVRPGDVVVLDVPLRAPSQPGRYLLMFDVQDSRGSSLASHGVPPGLTRVVVRAAPDRGDRMQRRKR